MKTVSIQLPLPDQKLSRNARVHHMALARIKKSHRQYARIEAHWMQGMRFSGYRHHFYWPTKHRRDMDNAGDSMKAYMDGIADACGQDDSNWDHNGIRFHYDKDNPRVEIEFTLTDDDQTETGNAL